MVSLHPLLAWPLGYLPFFLLDSLTVVFGCDLTVDCFTKRQALSGVLERLVVDDLVVRQQDHVVVGVEVSLGQAAAGAWPATRMGHDVGLVAHDRLGVTGRSICQRARHDRWHNGCRIGPKGSCGRDR